MLRKTVVIVAVLAVASQAFAAVLPFGDLRMKFINYETSTMYPNAPAYIYGSAAAADASKVSQALNPYPLAAGFQGGDGLEGAWGIMKCTEIYNVSDPLNPVWTASGTKTEITAMFYGLEDIYVTKNPTWPPAIIYGRDVKLDLYYDTTPDFNPTGGTAARTGLNTYPTVTDGALICSLVGTPGSFYNDVWPAGGIPTQTGLDASWRSSFDFGALTGLGDVYADVDLAAGGSDAENTDSGLIGSLLKRIPAVGFVDANVNGVWDPGESWVLRDNAGTKDDGSDWKFHWTAEPTQVADWSALSNDPATTYSVPEPATMSLVGLGLLALARRRRRA